MKSKYKSGKSVAKNQTVPIGVDDPRLAWNKVGQTKARQGAEIDIIGLDGKSLIQGGIGLNNGSSSTDKTVKPKPTTPGVPKAGNPPSAVTDLVGSWGTNNDILTTFTFDTTNETNQYIDRFLVKVYDSSTEQWYNLKSGYGYLGKTFLNYSSSSQQLTLSASDLSGALGLKTLISNISKIAIATADILTIGEYVEADMPGYASDLPQPEFTLSKGVDYYVVSIDPANLALAQTKDLLVGTIIEENITTETIKANVSLTNGWVQAAPITSNLTTVIYVPDGLHRWVRAKYVKSYGDPGPYSDIKDITPDPFMPTNTTPPTQFTAASIAWSGNDISVSFTQPSSNAGTTVKVKLVPYINGIESTSLAGYYYHLISGSETSYLIKSLDLYGQFGAYYSKFKAYITSISGQGIETTGAVISAGPIERSNPLANIYPTIGTPNVNTPTGVFRITSISNGYVVDFDLPVGATRLEVYEKSTAWTVIPTDDSNMIYSGLSPATIITPDNTVRYVIVRYYDQYDNYSHYSMELSGQGSGFQVTPIDFGTLSLIENPIKIQTDGSIFAGIGDSTEYPQVFFNKDGIFAYDSSGNWTTEIINTATTNQPTFITKRATIGDWTVAPTAIENTGYASGSTYTGLSASGTYAFWAGADASKNSDGLAKFSVTPAGAVIASNITINGNGAGGNLIYAGGGSFSVTQTGALTATSASISGSLTVTQQSYFNANVNISSGSYLISGGTGTDKVKIGSQGIIAVDQSDVASTKIYSDPIDVTLGGTTYPGISLWSQKALFGSTPNAGWLIYDGVIRSTYINIDSGNEAIIMRSQTLNSEAGILLQSSSDAQYAIAVGNIPHPDEAVFSVTTTGTLKAEDAVIKGTIKATGGFFGTDGGTQWEINSTGITASGSALINMGTTGRITMGNYEIYSDSSAGFRIFDGTGNVLSVSDVAGTTDPGRLILGQKAGTGVTARQVEVDKDAQISGSYSGGTTEDYRSGGLRNMYTITVNDFNTYPTPFQNAQKGAVLLVYNPSS